MKMLWPHFGGKKLLQLIQKRKICVSKRDGRVTSKREREREKWNDCKEERGVDIRQRKRVLESGMRLRERQMRACVCVRVRVCACVCVCLCVRVRACE